MAPETERKLQTSNISTFKFSIFIKRNRRYNFSNLGSTSFNACCHTSEDDKQIQKSLLYIIIHIFQGKHMVRYKETKSQSLRNCIHSSFVIQVHSVLNKATDFIYSCFMYASVPALLVTLSGNSAFENQRIIFLVEFVSLAKLYSFACSFT